MNEELLTKTYEEIAALKDLFLRRLMDDKVKVAAISQLKEQNESLQKRLDEKNLTGFVRELLLLCDRIDAQREVDLFTESVQEEILEILARREIYQMEVSNSFEPKFHNAVGTELASEDYPEKSIVKIVRKGYMLRDQVFRPADVIVAVKSIDE